MKSEKKTKKQNLPTVVPIEYRATDWYKALCEEITATVTETVYTANQTLLDGKLAIGGAISKQKAHMPVTELVQYVSVDLKLSERELWYCTKFYDQYKTVKKQIESDKSISWNKIKLLLADPKKAKEKKPCAHSHFTMIKLCDDCGSKIKED